MSRIFMLITATVLLTASTSAMANIPGATTRTGIGGRAAVFDEAFVAIADSASAIYWNPAGLANLRNYYSSALSHNSLFSGLFGLTGIQHDFVSFAHSERTWGVGVSVDRLGTNRVIEADKVGRVLSTEGSYSELRASFALSAKTGDIGSIGLTGNYFRTGAVTSSNDASIDIGMLSRGFVLFSRSQSQTQLRLRLGIALRSLYHSLDEISPQYAVATAFQLRSRGGFLSNVGSPLIALGYASRIAPNRIPKLIAGLELGPDAPNLGIVKGVKFHFGVEHYPDITDSFNWKAGVRIGGGGWWFNYAREQAELLGGSDRAAIDFGFDTKLIQNVTVRKIADDREIGGELKFETTDEIATIIHLLDDISLTEIERSGIQLMLTDVAGEKIGKVNYREMDLANGYTPRYVFRPVSRDAFEKWGLMRPGEYTVEISVYDKVRWREKFELHYDSDAQQIVKEARELFEGGNLDDAKVKLLDAVKRDPNYPDTYYIAGLVSELSDDFCGAQKCYMEARELSPEVFKNLRDVIGSQYLQTLTEQQDRENRPGIELYEQLKQAVFGMERLQ